MFFYFIICISFAQAKNKNIMNFKINDEINLDFGDKKIKIISEIGKGGQGTVYKVELDGKYYALKWYSETPKNSFYKNLKNNIEKGSPDKAFLWPQFLTEKDRSGKFGYVMELIPSEYKEFSQFLLAKEKFSNVVAIINAATNICNGFRALHNKGYSYQDINDGNFFINPKNGDVLICDNDNVSPFNESSGIVGKCRYMAPEVVSGKEKPNSNFDRYSLSVILFLLIFGNHPLEGSVVTSTPCLTEKHEKELYGEKAVFIYDPNDHSNRPVHGIHKNVLSRWSLYPDFVREKFVEVFSKNVLLDPNLRVTEKEWIEKVFQPLYHSLVRCQNGHESFVNPTDSYFACKSCSISYSMPVLLKIENKVTVLVKNKKVHRYLISTSGSNNGFDSHIGVVIESRKHPGVFGLRNDTNDTWMLILKDKSQRPIEPGKPAPLLRGNIISFSNGFSGEVL